MGKLGNAQIEAWIVHEDDRIGMVFFYVFLT